MNAVGLIGTILLICSSSAFVQAMPTGSGLEFVSLKPSIEGVDEQPLINQVGSSSFAKQHPHKGHSGLTGEDDDDDDGCFWWKMFTCNNCCGTC
ncbi:uncharacterized protein MELLADRAFT_124355 [Melampsora larici-populina 98AG31]|uniref:Secreted protein n=1 Tax=Melampsora larici-populina (strain 98AG31 / pathotype 3-4-7) TaxID=747676 RepID=F4RIK3_MELLP|nr:uncharacterized protein MELLADRAFT_124355 [Melampsora larici-populina 98AG31]EGG07821.1 secreted protein [Melampsora larici-populina 98AG31]